MLLMIFTLGPLVSVIIDSLREFQEGIWQWSVEGYLRLFRPTEGDPSFSHYGIRSESVWEDLDFMPAGNRIFQSDPEVGKHRQELRELVILLPMALSSVVFGISWFHFYQNSALFGISLEWILMAVHGILLCPYWVRMILPTMETVPRRWRDESRVLGHGAWEHQVRIVFPGFGPPF